MQFDIPSIALHTDLYHLTMAQGYWRLGMQNRLAVFDLFFRELPFQNGYAIACGLADVVNVLEKYTFSESDLQFLAKLPAPDGSALFQSDFLEALAQLKLTVDLDAMEEGTLVFPKEPLLRVQGPLWQGQLLETLLLNIVNFSTLIATKAARVCNAAGDDPVIEFGLRRAQGPNGGLMASRAAFVGGISATSNVLAGQLYGIELRGTHAHSWVMAFDSEREAFEAYARALPNNCIFLVDTYQTIEGVRQAIAVAQKLRATGYPFFGIRLDSGDLTQLSIAARQLLNEAGFKETKILASNDLDEHAIVKIKNEGAKIDIWGVGTRLVTGYDQPALGGVYKLVAIQDSKGVWQNKAKKTDNSSKQTLGGIYGVRRILSNGVFQRDELYHTDPLVLEKKGVEQKPIKELLLPIFREGKLVYSLPDLVSIRNHRKKQLAMLPNELKELAPSHQYPVQWIDKKGFNG